MTSGIESMRWTVRPLKERPGRVVTIFVIACLGFALGLILFSRPLMGLLGFAMILGSTMDQWLGSTYELDAQGAKTRVAASASDLRWGDVKRVLAGSRSIRLSPLEAASHLDAFRGVILRTTPENHADVMGFVQNHCSDGIVFQSVATEAS